MTGSEEEDFLSQAVSSLARSGRGHTICEFRPLPGVVLKTVDAIFEDINTVSDCKKKCMESPFKCNSFDLGDDSSSYSTTPTVSSSDSDPYEDYSESSLESSSQSSSLTSSSIRPSSSSSTSESTVDETFYYNGMKKLKKGHVRKNNRIKLSQRKNDRKVKSVCRLSNLDRETLSQYQKESPAYKKTTMSGATTYVMDTCFNVKVSCGRDHLRAHFKLNKAFTGKIYSMRSPTTCNQPLESTTAFTMNVPFFPSSSPYWDTIANNQHNNFKKANIDCGVTVSTVSGGPKPKSVSSSSSLTSSSSPSSSSSSAAKSKRDHLTLAKLPHHEDRQRSLFLNGSHPLRSSALNDLGESRVRSGNNHLNYHSDHTPSEVKDLNNKKMEDEMKMSSGPLIPAKIEPVENPNLSALKSLIPTNPETIRREFARFSVSLVLQRHALIMTSSDLDLTLNCDFDLSQQRIISNSIQMIASHNIPYEDYVHGSSSNVDPVIAEIQKKKPHHPSHLPPFPSPIPILPSLFPPTTAVSSPTSPTSLPAAPSASPPAPTLGSDFHTPPGSVPSSSLGQPNQGSSIMTTHEATFHSPVVKMGITDRNGGPVRAAEVGDPLSLRFELQSEDGRESLYEIFVKNIFADDGVDTVSTLIIIIMLTCQTWLTMTAVAEFFSLAEWIGADRFQRMPDWSTDHGSTQEDWINWFNQDLRGSIWSL